MRSAKAALFFFATPHAPLAPWQESGRSTENGEEGALKIVLHTFMLYAACCACNLEVNQSAKRNKSKATAAAAAAASNNYVSIDGAFVCARSKEVSEEQLSA